MENLLENNESNPKLVVANLQSITPNDLQAIKELTLKRFEEFGFLSIPELDADLDALQETYIQPGGTILVAKENGHIIGSIMVKVFSKGVGEVKRFQLLPEYRGKGIGGALLDNALTFMREHNFTKAVLDTTEKSATAISLFTKAGFVESKREGNQIFFELHFSDSKE
jgi:ribosomal protein S18 acetylase RimI-like enzyme